MEFSASFTRLHITKDTYHVRTYVQWTYASSTAPALRCRDKKITRGDPHIQTVQVTGIKVEQTSAPA